MASAVPSGAVIRVGIQFRNTNRVRCSLAECRMPVLQRIRRIYCAAGTVEISSQQPIFGHLEDKIDKEDVATWLHSHSLILTRCRCLGTIASQPRSS